MNEQEYLERTEALKARLYRTALLYLGSESAALDAVDEAVYKGLRAHGKLRRPEFFDTWMTRILINVCHGMYRRQKRWVLTEQVEPGKYVPSGDAELRMTLETLPEKLRLPLVLCYSEGMSYEEVAQTLRIPVTTVRGRIRRAKGALRKELNAE